MTFRSNGCGSLRTTDVDKEVTLSGWVHKRRDHGGLIFIDLRDSSGIAQAVFNPEANYESHTKAHSLRSEWVVKVEGIVRMRPKEAVNPHLPTGEIEVIVDNLEILNPSLVPPFEIAEDKEPAEDLRLKYRYLDLRRQRCRERLVLRHRVMQRARRFLDEKGFLEIETPQLIRSTPEGARDFLVPSRLIPGKFYALPQSPQLFKQILMVAGFERYFQVARCFRDEDLRADRQPEFTQLDIEASFIEEEDIYSLMEGFVRSLFLDVLGIDIPIPFIRIPYDDALLRFGTDKPDLRFDMEIRDLSYLSETDIKIFQTAPTIRGLKCQGLAWSRKESDELLEFVKNKGAGGLAWFKVEGESLSSPLAKFLKEDELKRLRSEFSVSIGDIILVVADKKKVVQQALSELRLHLGEKLGLIKESFSFCWIIDPPLMEYSEEEKAYKPSHHPFTSPKETDWQIMSISPEKAKARAYDLVLNGSEIGGGSIRIHRKELQEIVFNSLKIQEEAKKEFDFLLTAFSYGAPPHGGIALGLDRLIMMMAGASSIRDVIAFPKTQTGTCPLTSAPFPVSAEQLLELGIRILSK
ncbi:MAG: aspartate--tRNA ligase [bacterium]|nr:aspartate--tRNA ligase [bacterium]